MKLSDLGREAHLIHTSGSLLINMWVLPALGVFVLWSRKNNFQGNFQWGLQAQQLHRHLSQWVCANSYPPSEEKSILPPGLGVCLSCRALPAMVTDLGDQSIAKQAWLLLYCGQHSCLLVVQEYLNPSILKSLVWNGRYLHEKICMSSQTHQIISSWLRILNTM